jgi:uncharacterized membrane protein SpoIIM required for sporulation
VDRLPEATGQRSAHLKGILSFLGVVVLIVGLMPVIVTLDGWAVSVLWAWFMVPYLHLPVLPVAVAIGVRLVISLLTFQEVDTPKEKKEEAWYSILFRALARPFLAVAFGYVVKLFC